MFLFDFPKVHIKLGKVKFFGVNQIKNGAVHNSNFLIGEPPTDCRVKSLRIFEISEVTLRQTGLKY